MQTSLISWTFFTLNVMMFGFVIRGDGKRTTQLWALKIANLLNYYSAMMIILDILYLLLIGEAGQNERSFKKNLPVLYEHLDIIGFKNDAITYKNGNDELKIRFYTYITFQLVSIYVAGYFEEQLK